MGLGAGTVERHHGGDAGLRRLRRGAGAEGVGVEAVEAAGLHALRQRDRHRLAAQRAPGRQQLRPGQAVGNPQVAQRLGEQHRAVAELAPKV